MASIELVDARWADFRTVDVASLIADGFFHAAVVLGIEHDVPAKGLAALAGAMTVDGREVGRGLGADILGDPMNVLAWLANHAAGRGETLAAGQMVTLGSLCPPHWISGTASVVVEIEALGTVTLELA